MKIDTFTCLLMFAFSYSLIDDGKNPDEFTKDVLNSCIARNQVTKGKTDAFKVTPFLLILNLCMILKVTESLNQHFVINRI